MEPRGTAGGGSGVAGDIVSLTDKVTGTGSTTLTITDSTILENITFGVDPQNVDFKKLDKAIKIANLDDMINNLPEKLQTKIGERGVMMSGGQAQRLGLARAFYKDFEILILDESTNALDIDTENLVHSNIQNAFVDKTIFSITHNRELSKNFDSKL